MTRARPHADNRHQRPSGVRLSAAHQMWLYAIAVLLLASGAIWLGFHYFVIVHGDFGSAHHPLEPWFLKIHGAAAMTFLVVFGTLLPIHLRRAWQLHRNRSSGATMFASIAWLTTTGWGLHYLGDESLRAAASGAHWVAGLAIAPMFALHVALGRHLRKASLSRELRIAFPKLQAAHEFSGHSNAKLEAAQVSLERRIEDSRKVNRF